MITIPAVCLDLLGGLKDEDPPALLTGGLYAPRAWADAENIPIPQGRVLLPQSAPALCAVLARRHGLDPAGGVAFHVDSSSELWLFDADGDGIGFGARCAPVCVPTLAGITDPLRALAEVCCWLARLERYAQTYRANEEGPVPDIGPEALADFEETWNLPPLDGREMEDTT